MPPLSEPPSLLALGGGGILGEAWMTAVLAGIEDAGGFDARDSEHFIGTSAGSIVAAALAGGVSAGSRVGDASELPALPSDDSLTSPRCRGCWARRWPSARPWPLRSQRWRCTRRPVRARPPAAPRWRARRWAGARSATSAA